MSPPATRHRTVDVGATAGALVVAGLAAAVARGGRAVLMLSGGTSPEPVLDWLAVNLPADLARATTVTWTDERVVDHDPAAPWASWPAELNRRSAWERWFSRVEVRPSEAPLWSGGGDPEAAIAGRRLPEVDVLLLGIGPDGHLASLFSGHPALRAGGDLVVVRDAPKPPPVRISATLSALGRARTVVLVATGVEKGRRLAEVLAGAATTPIGRYVARDRWDWVLDPAAAAALEGA